MDWGVGGGGWRGRKGGGGPGSKDARWESELEDGQNAVRDVAEPCSFTPFPMVPCRNLSISLLHLLGKEMRTSPPSKHTRPTPFRPAAPSPPGSTLPPPRPHSSEANRRLGSRPPTRTRPSCVVCSATARLTVEDESFRRSAVSTRLTLTRTRLMRSLLAQCRARHLILGERRSGSPFPQRHRAYRGT